jgi:hypothetical protein
MSDTGPLPAVPAFLPPDDELAGLMAEAVAACKVTAAAARRAGTRGADPAGWQYCAARLAELEQAIRAASRLRLFPGAWHTAAHEPRHARVPSPRSGRLRIVGRS